MAKHLHLLTSLLALLLTPSCLFLRQNQHSYILAPENGVSSAAQATRTLEAVKLPGYLDRHEMVYLAKNGELVKVGKSKWAQPLGALLKDSLTMALRQSDRATASKASVVLELEQFLMDATGAFHVAGILSLHSETTPTLRVPIAFSLPSLGAPSAERIVIQSRAALARLADAICAVELPPSAGSEP
ncbi:MAG: membrane integrity-associated transporter subunit PqiC [Victivallales bacterium]|nr:membrane integrity-associated transporter subunit PqiC [Victivallales bacterium]